MQEPVKERSSESATGSTPYTTAEPRTPKQEGVILWRAVAGMALSVALACAIVALEFSDQAAHHVGRLQRRVSILVSRLYRTQAEVASERMQLAAMRRELAATEALRTVLLAPDLAVIRLAPPKASSRRSAGTANSPGALLAFSPRQHSAVLRVTGLSPAPADKAFVLWWNAAAHAAPARAVEFFTAPSDGNALVLFALPDRFTPSAAIVTIENSGAHGASPSGSVHLRGTLRR
jgi:Anti-sigma-K factor rskA